MVQPNPEARLRRLKPRGGEEHTPLVDPQTPRSDVILHGVYLDSATHVWLKYDFHRPKMRPENADTVHKDSTSSLPKILPYLIITFWVFGKRNRGRCLQVYVQPRIIDFDAK